MNTGLERKSKGNKKGISTTYQNLWDMIKAVFRERSFQSMLRSKLENYQANVLTTLLKELEK